jgi:hypothetical protein
MPEVDLLIDDELIIAVVPQSQLGLLWHLDFHHVAEMHLVASVAKPQYLEVFAFDLLDACFIAV